MFIGLVTGGTVSALATSIWAQAWIDSLQTIFSSSFSRWLIGYCFRHPLWPSLFGAFVLGAVLRTLRGKLDERAAFDPPSTV